MPDTSHTAVLFDFDHTIINKDSVAEFIFFGLRESRLRMVLLMLMLLPLVALSVSKRTLWWRNLLVYKCATGGMSRARFDALLQRFFAHFHGELGGRAYEDALTVLGEHQQQGHRVYVISGAFEWMVEALCHQLGIENVTVIGSDVAFYCYGQNKVVRLEQFGIPDAHPYLVGYSDSAADIPMLGLCHEAYVVNPKPRCRARFSRALPDAKALTWR